MIITHNGTILKHDGTILTKITEVPPQPPFTNTYSLDFDGVDDYVSTNSKIIASDITLSGWVNFNGSYSNFSAHFPMSITPSNTNVPNETLGRFYKDGSTLQIAIQCYDSTGANFSTYYVDNTTLEGAGWQHICITYNVTTKHIYAYLNGVAQNWIKIFGASTPVPFLTAVSTRIYESDLTIGRVKPTTSTGNYLGLVDEVSTYNRILTQEEITSIASAPSDLTSLNPTLWLRMGDNGSYKSPQWLIPNNENKDKVSNYSFDLDGVDDYIDLGNDSSLDIFGSDFTISLWAKWGAQTSNSNGLINFAVNTKKAVITLGFSTQYGKISFGTGSASTVGILYDCGSGYDDNNWHHIMCTLQGSTRTIYVDGVDISSTGSVSSIGVGSNNDIGNRARSRYFVGNIDEVSIFDSVIPIANLWDGSGEPTTIMGAVAHYRMGEEANFTSNWLVDNSTSPNRSLKFDNTYVTSPPWSGYQGLRASTTAISSNHITLSTWFKSTDSGNNQGEIFKTSLYSIKVYNHRVYLFKAGALYRYWNSSDLFNGSWHNIIIYIPNTATWDLADVKIYVDNADLGAGTGINDGTGVPQITDIYGLFRTSTGGGGTMTAEISNWAYWLSDKRDDVSTIYNNGVPGDLSSLSPNVWWKLDSGTVTTDTQVDVIDSSGNNVTGTGPRNAAKTIPVLVSSTVNSRPPYSKRSFVFDGMGDKIELSTQSLGLTGAISVSAWVKIPTTNTGGAAPYIQHIVCEDRLGGTTRNWILNWRGGTFKNGFTAAIFDSSGTAISINSATPTPNDNQWHHVMFTYMGDTTTNGLKLFVDGVQIAQGTSANGGLRSTSTVIPTIGGVSNSTQRMFEGNIDEVSIFNTDQSANVSTIYNDGIPNDLTELSPLHWYRMGEDASFNGTNWTVPDQVGTNNGTSDGMMVDALVGEAPNYSGGGISQGMDIEDRVGNAPKSDNNALSYNMEREDRVEDIP